MPTDILIYNSTTVTATITMSSMVTLTTSSNNAWQGNFVDFGTPRGERWLAKLTAAFTAAPTAGGTLELYMSWSSATATANNWPGGCTGVNGNFAGPDTNPVNALPQLDWLGSLSAAATGSTVQQITEIGPFVARERYGTPVVAMRTSQVLSSQSASHTLTFIEIRTQAQ